MHIGMIGGIGPAATDAYYRRLIRLFGDRGADLVLTMAHADSPTLLRHLAANQADEQAQIFADLTRRLAKAGAEVVVVTSIAGHFCRAPFKALSPLPVIDLIEAVDRAIAASPWRRIGVLGTATVMATKFYGGITQASLVAPVGPAATSVHQAYAAMAMSGVATSDQRHVFLDAAQDLVANQGAEAILLGGTDLALVFDGLATPYPVIDCIDIHTQAIVPAALGGGLSEVA